MTCLDAKLRNLTLYTYICIYIYMTVYVLVYGLFWYQLNASVTLLHTSAACLLFYGIYLVLSDRCVMAQGSARTPWHARGGRQLISMIKPVETLTLRRVFGNLPSVSHRVRTSPLTPHQSLHSHRSIGEKWWKIKTHTKRSQTQQIEHDPTAGSCIRFA